jgi:erythronate-4-phosphate dehydrogenase
MIIATDEQIPYWGEAFSQFGQIRLFSGRDLKSADIRNADALVVRTITPVNASLLEGSSVKFVGAASAGTDHVDQAYLKKRGIYFCYAAGCNANCVSEYIITSLHIMAARRGWDLKTKSLAVIGVGNVGSRVAKKAGALGMNVYLCDPPLRDSTGDSRYKSLDEVLGADILTFHVPLSTGGPYPTLHMLDREILDRLSPEQFVINSSRGEVFDGVELKAALKGGRISGAVLDVWEGEPEIDFSLLELVDIGTPHIAGLSLDGKIRATEMIREELSSFWGIQSTRLADSVYSETKNIFPAVGTTGQEAVASVLLQAFQLLKKDEGLRALGSVQAHQAAAGFDHLRNQRPLHLEFRHFTVDLGKIHIDLSGCFAALGFNIRTAEPD